MMKQIIKNAIQTPDGTVLVSKHRHDFVAHTDANGERYFIDGGTDYQRLSVNKISAKDLSVYDDAPYEVIRESIYRGGRGKDGTEELKYVKLSEMDDEWLLNVIIYELEHRPDNPQLKWYKMEKEYRNI